MDSLTKVRQEIDELDGQLIDLLTKRQKLVEKAGRLKPSNDAKAVAAPERVAAILAERRRQASKTGLSPDVAEAVWKAMIEAFIHLETEINKS
ncbi:chorismate mutase [Streptococcus dentiloxodontae]